MSATINFPDYPVSNRTPGVFADIDPSKANTALVNQAALIIGQCNSASASAFIGTAALGLPQLSTGVAAAQQKYGSRSLLANMLQWYRNEDSFGTVWELPLADGASAVAQVSTVTIGGAATAAGVLSLYVMGELVAVPVNSGDTPTVIAANLVALLAGTTLTDLPVTATAAAGVATLTSTIVGLAGADLDLRLNYLGAPAGEITPPGLTVTFASGTTGAINPSLAAPLAALGDQPFDFIVSPYTDSASLTALDAFLSAQTGRWSWQQMLYGGYFCAIRGTQGTLASTGLARNGANGTALGFYDGPDPAWAWAADYAGACAVSLRADPGVPLQYLTLNVKAPPLPSRFIRSARNTLLYDGISTFRVNAASQVELERAINFYQTNAAGAADNSFLDVETNYGLMFLIRDMQNFLLTQFPRKKLVADGTRIPPGSSMVSPTTVKTAVIARYRRQCLDGYAQQPDTFAANIVAVDAGNGALQLLLPFVLVNQLRQIPMLVQFTKP